MLKNILNVFLEKSHLNHLLFVFLIILSVISYNNLAKEMFPSHALDTIIIKGNYSGSSSSVLDKLIVYDIEKILDDNIYTEKIKSEIINSSYTITANITDKTKKQNVINAIKNKIDTLKKDLPNDMNLPSVNTIESFFKLLDISISSKNRSNDVNNQNIINIAKDLQKDISNLKNIYSASFIGDYEEIISLKINSAKLQAYGISTNELIYELKNFYSLYPIGKINTKTRKYSLISKNKNITLENIKNKKLYLSNKSFYLKDIAEVFYSYDDNFLITRTNANKSIVLEIKKAKKGDSLKLADEIKDLIKTYEKNNENIEFSVQADSSFWVKTRFNMIYSNILIALVLLFLSIWLFVSLKIALIVIIGIPISFAFGLIGLDFFDYSLNTLSMIGVLLSLGIIVDEAIVVSENIHRHLRMGKSVHQACLDGTSEVLGILFASLLTTVIAFIPLTMIDGSVGLFIKIIPLMLIILIVSSFIESFIFLPLHYKELSFFSFKESPLKEKFWNYLSKRYKNLLSYLLEKKLIFLSSLFVFTFLCTFILIKTFSFSLFPIFDAMSINIMAKVNNNSLDYTLNQSRELENLLLEELDKDNISSLSSFIGINSDGRSKKDLSANLFTLRLNLNEKIPDNFFNLYINPIFSPYSKGPNQTRTLSAIQIKEKIKKILKKNNITKGFKEFSISIPQTGVVKNDIKISFAHKSKDEIKYAINTLSKRFLDFKEVDNIKNDMNFDDISLEFELNSYGKSLGFTQKELINKIRFLVNNEKVNKVLNKKDDLISLKLDFSNSSIKNIENISLKLKTENKFVRLKDIVNIVYIKEINKIKKENLVNIFSLTASLDKKNFSSKEFYLKITNDIKELKNRGIKIYIKGEQKANSDIQKNLMISALFCLFLILLVLTWLFSSFFLSLLALSVIPLSILGVLAGHKILGINLSFPSLLGFVGLIGIVINDTLIMLKFIQKYDCKNDYLEKASLRIRPILLTSITTIIGLCTLIFFASGESLLMQPLAVSIGFGLLWATVINLFYIPVFFYKKEKIYDND